MTITLTPDIEQLLTEQARVQGTTPEALAIERLRHDFVAPLRHDFVAPAQNYTVKTIPPPSAEPIPHDEWMRRLRGIAVDCGVSLTDEQVSRESLYDDHL